MGVKVISPGLLTTVQDAGRRGYQRYGMAVSGCIDTHSYHYANILVGNSEEEAVLEATIAGPILEITSDCVIAVTGGNLSPTLNGAPLPMYRAVQVSSGDNLSFGPLRSGCRAYIAFSGGLDVPEIMGSRSTYLKAGIGGLDGRKLAAGDEIAFREAVPRLRNMERRQMPPDVFSGNYTVRVLMGPQDDMYTEKGIHTFLSSVYKVTDRFDRMGYRLSGPKIEAVGDGNIITDGIAFGAVQVPQEGEPIIMLADRQTTGGYAKIANVINMDMPMISQCKAGDTIRFVKTDIDTAQTLFIGQKEKYAALRASFERIPTGAVRTFTVTVNNRTYDVTVEALED